MMPSAAVGRMSTRTDPSTSSSGAEEKLRLIVRAAVSRAPTSTAPSWLRYSSAPNQNAFCASSGPPTAAAYCSRSNGGFSEDDGSKVGGCACHRLLRPKTDTEPRSWSDPLFVTTLMTEDADRPYSAVNRLVAIWNSWT